MNVTRISNKCGYLLRFRKFFGVWIDEKEFGGHYAVDTLIAWYTVNLRGSRYALGSLAS